jgi:predicted NUDIX family NTP pyrophosphohydrolase
MTKQSAGLIMYRCRDMSIEILLLHPGGPFWSMKDEGAWTIPKGEIEGGEEPLDAAKREFEEETGLRPEGVFYPLRPVQLKSRKIVHAWAFEGDWDPTGIESMTFTIEWPIRSGRMQEYPEADKADWFSFARAKEKIHVGQRGFLEELEGLVGCEPAGGGKPE